MAGLMTEEEIYDLFDKYANRWDLDGPTVGYDDFEKAIKEVLLINSVCKCNSESDNYGYGFAKCFNCGKIKEIKENEYKNNFIFKK